MADLKRLREQARANLLKAKDQVEQAQQQYWQLQGMVMLFDDLIREEERDAKPDA